MLTVTQSKLKLWRKCRYAYALRYIDYIIPRVPSVPAWRGNWLHELLEPHYSDVSRIKKRRLVTSVNNKYIKQYEKLFKHEQELLDFTPEDINTLYEGYKDYYKDEKLIALKNKNTGKFSEHVLTVDVYKGIQLEGTLDLVAQEQNFNFVFDHKTSKNEPPTQHLAFSDIQNLNYIILLEHYKEDFGITKVDGMIWNYFWTKTPTIPPLLANGVSLSKNKNIITWPEMWESQIEKYDLDIEDYIAQIELAKENKARWFNRFKVPVRSNLLKAFLGDAISTAKEIKQLAGKDRTRNLEWHCSNCDYNHLCNAEIRGLDASQIKKIRYKSAK